jgi:pilus assembly protein CpaB
MNRQTRTLIVLAVALLAAGTAAYGVYAAIARIPVREVEIATRHAVVAAKPMPLGTMLTADTVKLVAWPAQTPIVGGFDTVESVVNRGLVAAVSENEPITETKLAPREAGAGLAPAIPPGMRAMSVRVNEVIGVAGFVVPGTRVDLMVTITANAQSRTQVVVSNVQVLAANTRYDQENAMREGKAIPSTVVTLLVTPEDAERITLAQAEGTLMLALRNPLDTDPTKTDGVRSASLFGEPPPPPRPAPPRPPAPRPIAAAPAPAPPPPAIYTVEAIRAAKRTEEVVK